MRDHKMEAIVFETGRDGKQQEVIGRRWKTGRSVRQTASDGDGP